mgnify:CR=1 FL=1
MERIKKKFGFGMIRLPMNGEDVNIEETKKMVDALSLRCLIYGFHWYFFMSTQPFGLNSTPSLSRSERCSAHPGAVRPELLTTR